MNVPVTLLAVVTVLAAVSPVSAQGSPGAGFEARLRQAERRVLRSTAKPAPPARVRVVRARKTHPVPVRHRAYRLAAAAMPRPLVQKTAPPAAAPPVVAPPQWLFQSANLADVRYSIDPRAATSNASGKTGDLILRAEPEDVPVYFYLDGGAQVDGITRAVVKSRRPPARGKVQLVASAPQIGGRAVVFVPLKQGHITTVRFVFHAPSPDASVAPVQAPAPAAPPKASTLAGSEDR
jgi:hypothetical protein